MGVTRGREGGCSWARDALWGDGHVLKSGRGDRCTTSILEHGPGKGGQVDGTDARYTST